MLPMGVKSDIKRNKKQQLIDKNSLLFKKCEDNLNLNIVLCRNVSQSYSHNF